LGHHGHPVVALKNEIVTRVTPQELARGVPLPPARRHVVVVVAPPVYRGRLTGALYEKNKAFMLPSAIPGVIGLVDYFEEHPESKVLVVGHTDTTATDDYNLTLSVERAEAMASFLREDSAAWVKFFDHQEDQKRWGRREVQLMLTALPDQSKPFLEPTEVGTASDKRHKAAVSDFQTFSNDARGTSLQVDGIDGPQTREALVQAYMAIDGTSLPEGTTLQSHGCGPFHPAVPTGPGTDEPANRRVEIFLFSDAIDPPAQPCAAPGCAEYPQWVAVLTETIDLDLGRLKDQLPLELAVLKSDDGPITLVVEDGAGSEIVALPETAALREDNGFFIFGLQPGLLPNPAVFRRRAAAGTDFLGGPVDLFALRAALREGDLAGADGLLGGEPAPEADGGDGVAVDFDDGHL
jgi:outer membrane protein OmpA-like peptidoglycan-associated protein